MSRTLRDWIGRLTFAGGAVLLLAGGAVAQTVQARISSDEAFVGEGLFVDVVVSNMSEDVQPMPPETTDFEIIPASGNPVNRSQRSLIYNSRRTVSIDLTYRYEVHPLREGYLVLPPFRVDYKGRVLHTQQFPVRVVKDTSGSLVFCRILAPTDIVYVAQPVELTLEIWVQKYSQRGIGTLDAASMWSLRDGQATSPGVFDQADWERPRYREDTQKDDDGTPHGYFVYLLSSTVYAKTVGPFDFGDVAFAYQYPVEIGRGVFNMTLQRARRLRVRPELPKLTVKAIPQENRPPGFNGAVGTYSIEAWAKPTTVPIGDPITLTLAIRGDGPLERLSPPKLSAVEALTRDFEVSGESPAGTIEGERKLFSQTIRPLREDVQTIPAIPLSFLDPQTGKFETVYSDPIAISVKPADRLVVSTLPGPNERGSVLSPLVETTEGLLANYSDPDEVLSDQSGGLSIGSMTVLVLMPIIYGVTWLLQTRLQRYRGNEALRRRSRARTAARRALQEAEAAASSAGVAAALTGYVADRCNAPPGDTTRADALRLLAERQAPAQVLLELDALLEKLEAAQYGGGLSASSVSDWSAAARRLLDALERCKLR